MPRVEKNSRLSGLDGHVERGGERSHVAVKEWKVACERIDRNAAARLHQGFSPAANGSWVRLDPTFDERCFFDCRHHHHLLRTESAEQGTPARSSSNSRARRRSGVRTVTRWRA